MSAPTSPPESLSGWIDSPLTNIVPRDREAHVRYCSYFASDLMDRYGLEAQSLNRYLPPKAKTLKVALTEAGLEAGLRRFRNQQMLRIIWRDLCGLATLAETFSDLTQLAELCLQAAIDEHGMRLREKYGTPRDEDGGEQGLFVIGMGKFGGGELNLSSDIDVLFCYHKTGVCDGRKKMANHQYFTRLARSVIASLSDVTADGFCFRVDTRLRPFGDSGPLTTSIASMEQYYQREGRDWERYALIKARPVAGDLVSGALLLENLRPFIYRRYIDYGSVEALQEMHSSVREDAKRKGRMDDIKRGPGGIREIEFLAQCFQILRGGRELSLQSHSLDQALGQIAELKLMSPAAVLNLRHDYVYLRRLENRIQALRDQQTHRLPGGQDLERIAQGMGEQSPEALTRRLSGVRRQVSKRFEALFPSREALKEDDQWLTKWRNLQTDRQGIDPTPDQPQSGSMAIFMRRLDRISLSHRARKRLNRFMPLLLKRIDRHDLDQKTLGRVFDLVIAICRRSAYLVLLVQHVPALDRMLDLFARSEWIADRVIRFPALLDELIDPSLGRQIPAETDLEQSVIRLLTTARGAETVLEGLNYLKLASGLRIAVAQLQGILSVEQAQLALSGLAAAILKAVLALAGKELDVRHGRFPTTEGKHEIQADEKLAIVAYGTLGAGELIYGSDLDIVFLFEAGHKMSGGPRPLPAERYFARLAQRVLSYLRIMTPSGRLYEADTRLRPNGRAGSLVSSLSAFREYQLNEAWTWELQALTRTRFITGSRALSVRLDRIRQEVLCLPRDTGELRSDLQNMRMKMREEHDANIRLDTAHSPKYRPGGLIDIEFIAQLGVLTSARAFPRILKATGTLPQIAQLKAIGWLGEEDARVLEQTAVKLQHQRMIESLTPGERASPVDTQESARIFGEMLGLKPRVP